VVMAQYADDIIIKCETEDQVKNTANRLIEAERGVRLQY